MVRLVVCDVDGTLFDKDEILDEAAVRLVAKLHAKGISFSLATGRVECMANDLANRLGLRIPYVACNGATLVECGKAIYRRQVMGGPLMEIMKNADSSGCTVIYSINGEESAWRETPYVLSQREKFGRYTNVLPLDSENDGEFFLDKLTIMDENSSCFIHKLESACRSLNKEYGYTRYGDKAIEIVHSSATKATGVARLAALLGIDMEDVLFIGDHQNDIQLMADAGIGAAVANSTDDVKRAADYVCKKGYMEGVIEAVDRFCFGGNR